MKTIKAMAMAACVAAAMACGGAVVEPERGCDVEGVVTACDAEHDFYVFESEDGVVVGDQCSRVGCRVGNRCAVFGADGISYGRCR